MIEKRGRGRPKGIIKELKTNDIIDGRPALFKTPESFKIKADEYFDNCPDKRKVLGKDLDGVPCEVEVTCITLTGLALFMGFSTRQSLHDYAKKEDFKKVVEYAQSRAQQNYEGMLHNPACTGAIFALKNMGWSDKIEMKTENVNINKTAEELDKFFAE